MKKFLSIISFLLISILSFAAETVKIQILDTTDSHGTFMPYAYATASENMNGSLVQVSTVLKKLRAENKNTLFFFNGDIIQDNYNEIFLKEKENPMIVAMNEMKADAFVAGNHEFNFGIETLKNNIANFKGTFLIANLYKDGKRVFTPYKIYTLNGVKVALIGVTSPSIMTWDSENLKGYEAKNPVEEVKSIIPELKGKADVIIVGIHAGVNPEYGNGDSGTEVAEGNPEVAAVFTGHDHGAIVTKAKNGTVVVDAGKWAENIGKVDITLTKENNSWVIKDRATDVVGSLVSIKNVEPDKELVKKLQPFHQRALDEAASPITKKIGDKVIEAKLEGGPLVPQDEIPGIATGKIQPTAMIQLINEVQMYYTKADVSSAAVFRNDANMQPGPIKKSDIALIYKYDNTLRAYRVTGAQLKKYMEWTAEYYDQYKKGDLTVGFSDTMAAYNYDMFYGIKYDVNISKPAGKRIENLTKMDGTKIKDTDTLVLAVNDYRGKTTLVGNLFKENPPELVVDLAVKLGDGGRIRTLIGEYIRDVRDCILTPVVNPNWKITGNNWDAKKHAEVAELVKQGKIKIKNKGYADNAEAITEKDLEEAKK